MRKEIFAQIGINGDAHAFKNVIGLHLPRARWNRGFSGFFYIDVQKKGNNAIITKLLKCKRYRKLPSYC